jgi:ketosteroid isomerase-like protein
MMGVLALVAIVGVSGCATTGGGGATDEELIMGQLTAWRDGLQNDDVDAAMAVYSEDVVGFEGSDKEGLSAFFKGASDSGDLANIDFIIDEATVTVEGDSAEVSPVYIAGDFGEFAMVFLMEKEEGTWRIIGQEGVED